MATISGILINGAGQPLPNVQIVLTALKTSSKVLNQSKALITTTSETGAYSINAQVGNYAVTILRNGYPVEKVGCIKVYVDSQDGTLNDYLLNPNESEISPEILAQIVEERKLAQKSASDAKNSANEAVETLENCVKKTGEASQTVDGTLDIKELKENGNRVYSKGNKPNPSDINAVSLTGKESQTVEGVLNATNLQENGQRVYSPNNKPTASDVEALSTDGGTVTGDLTISKSNPQIMIKNQSGVYSYRIVATNSLAAHYINSQNRLRYTYASNTWNFENSSVTISGAAVLKVGDGGLLVSGGMAQTLVSASSDMSSFALNSISFARDTQGVVLPTNSFGYLHKRGLRDSGNGGGAFTFQPYNSSDVYFGRQDSSNLNPTWAKAITTVNTTVDSNGFLKSASPIIRLFSDKNMELVDGFEKSGCGLINSEAKGVTATKIAVGHYEIHGSLGFAKEGWYITLPEDANGNKKLFAEYSTDENNVITIKTYMKKFDFEKCEVVAGEPQDITDGRWIDIRLEMPIIEIVEQIEPIPSTLNPIMS